MEHNSKTYNAELQRLIETLDETYTSLSIEIAQNKLLVQQLEEIKISKNDYTLELNQLRERVGELDKKIKELHKERDYFKKRCSVIENSSLWKATKPIRKLLDSIKGVKGNKGTKKTNLKENTKIIKEPIAQVKPKVQPKAKPEDIAPKIALFKNYLYDMGVFEKALEDFNRLYENAKTTHHKRLLGWELLLCYVNQGDKESARQALKVVPSIKDQGCGPDRFRNASIMEAECHHILGDIEGAKGIILGELKKESHPDLYLAASRLESSMELRLEWVNKLMGKFGLMNVLMTNDDSNKKLFDRIKGALLADTNEGKKGFEECAKVTVIMPVYNSSEVISTAIESLLVQTWSNLEILIVDDHSDDNTLAIIKEYASKDKRIKVLQTKENSGAYIARNTALQIATGEFVTCHDADDWSHPQKIERQALHLLENPQVVANTSEWARATNDLLFHRKGTPGNYLNPNMSSLMFRRKLILEKLGYWDPVRFSADYEFITRIVKIFGKEAFVNLETGLLSFGREAEGSLTSNSKFGFNGFAFGARKEYLETFKHFHERSTSLRYDFPQAKRLFPVPIPMLPERKSFSNNYDLIVGSDFRASTLEDVKELKNFKEQVKNYMGIFQMSVYGLMPTPVTSEVRNLMDDKLRMIVYGEKVSCKLLILKYSEILKYRQRFIPEIKADKIIVIIDRVSDLEYYRKNLLDYFGKQAQWYPLNSSVRQALLDNNQKIKQGEMESQNWEDIKGGIFFEPKCS